MCAVYLRGRNLSIERRVLDPSPLEALHGNYQAGSVYAGNLRYLDDGTAVWVVCTVFYPASFILGRLTWAGVLGVIFLVFVPSRLD